MLAVDLCRCRRLGGFLSKAPLIEGLQRNIPSSGWKEDTGIDLDPTRRTQPQDKTTLQRHLLNKVSAGVEIRRDWRVSIPDESGMRIVRKCGRKLQQQGYPESSLLKEP